MSYEIIKATSNDRELLQNLLQLYFYDFSEFIDIDLEENGRYKSYPYLDAYWEEDNRFPYLIKYNDQLAGLVLVRWIEEDSRSFFSIAEFFIMKKYRRLGLGKRVAIDMFQRYKGKWEVFQTDTNIPAQHFWKGVIDEFTGGKFTNRHDKKNDSRVTIQEFVS
ncbi:GNAT family N-acetyltransferase [Filobacillus milosensis]|uniref:GNAT family N-acetyltransferase n=1 Tax=Filobacillus milosensis TaxID=94137 RepID=A0A4Y8IHK9_9BACI|nr:GNAT family N-acetyltransferase [Filobacillus milosensis]TFB18540.1 GNAT family N-acetyltransferase [Filobacillus milosensis]